MTCDRQVLHGVFHWRMHSVVHTCSQWRGGRQSHPSRRNCAGSLVAVWGSQMKTATRLFQGLDCIKRAYHRGWAHGFTAGAIAVLVVQVFVLLAMEAM